MQFESSSKQYEWFFACPQFIEPLLAEELLSLGAAQIKIGHSGVQAWGDLAFAYRALIWSRLASRATLQLAQGFGKNQAELVQLIKTIPWEEHLRLDGSFKVRFSGLNEDIRNTQFGAQWVKDQIVDLMRTDEGQRPSISANPDLVVSVNLHKGKASIGIDLNQKGLHQRGYRDPEAYYALHENLAAAVLIRSGWHNLLQSNAKSICFLDPICGSGEFITEAALMALDIAPALLRGATVAQRWLKHDADLYSQLLLEARERQQSGLAQAERFRFIGADADREKLTTAQSDWAAVKLPAAQWFQQEPKQLKFVEFRAEAGLMLTQLPYDAEQNSIHWRTQYAAFGQACAQLPEAFQGALFAPAEAPLAYTDLFYSKTYRFLNGRDEYQLWTLEKVLQKAKPSNWISEDFANRIEKNLRKLKGFIQRGHTNAYRIYDADIPEYAVAVDRYADWLQVQEYAPPATIDEKTAQQRLDQVLITLSEVLKIPAEKIILKQRKRQKGLEQYERQAQGGQSLIVYEHGVHFKVNLIDYLDTGLFLDHRPMRWWMQQQAQGKSVLNLFCYTGAVSVHAAIGGASRVDSVDLSATYLAWAEENLQLNQLKLNPYKYRMIRANVVEWLANCQQTYDLIFLDPPTFSNSKRMQDVFDVQRDHVELLHHAMRVLNKNGTLVFSNNFRKFKLDPVITERYRVEDYRIPSIPEDFQRDPKIHSCWLLRAR
ncbi:bifunctional 23S rRNA (guanine(2069)-N(7))-methyltransferase RlmK/23S rRNA (guanine(2445)-N(2))-methyltransferase RlmL [uncultured Thiothrix sp.]|uniref:bifunctional 23S rRNA (guanine(2069)-N(7))-methyltransferase RlmK/23S rRNA (guanine(2445)-N(2))-methyltransferase RlmL n=1 Tax=uncultured Thiothrix sp. TaxID=223185 RepID=UPI0026150051|nr:bifunctional 23S rRNA (guanine(2069)-N(7))-methyltransferase RlmK/23S rRNA (guanine(2445)-N(2))-methyltransferase RlmL [uncultured Thiothrix sp.]HMT93146.1 bifunctional 23S rRNA (guanine(2069)-N(7))-methyltransferase RlmK/23S rRNA (guanine(2445)-N(2))-methyltransferase RlmL [Thiolinea sp.]